LVYQKIIRFYTIGIAREKCSNSRLDRPEDEVKLKGYLRLKFLVNIICCFVPKKKWRKSIRHNLISKRQRQKQLLEYGCKIDGNVLTTPQGVKINVSEKLDNPLHLVIEVFVNSEYDLNITKDAVLIDIGMNRAVASLHFAADEHIKKIYSYEPFKPTFEMAQDNLRLNPQLSEKIVPHNCGLGKSDGTLELFYSAAASVGMSTTHNVCKSKDDAKKELVVIKDAAQEISAVLKENKGKYVILKCDCEGAEYEIFERLYEKDIFSHIDVVMMEYHFEKPDRLVDILNENDFAVQTKIGSVKSKTGYIYAVRMAKKDIVP
jgi:FkbM family methyltransferase